MANTFHIGLGTPNPSAKLHIKGTTAATSGQVLTSSCSGVMSWTTPVYKDEYYLFGDVVNLASGGFNKMVLSVLISCLNTYGYQMWEDFKNQPSYKDLEKEDIDCIEMCVSKRRREDKINYLTK